MPIQDPRTSALVAHRLRRVVLRASHNEAVNTDGLQVTLDAIAARRAEITDLGAELRQRIDELGEARLNTQARQNAFAEVIEAITPPNFDVFPYPDGRFQRPPTSLRMALLRQFFAVLFLEFSGTIGRHEPVTERAELRSGGGWPLHHAARWRPDSAGAQNSKRADPR